VPELSHLTRVKRVNAQVDLGDGDVLAISFDANKLNPVWLAGAQGSQEEGDPLSMANSLAEVVLEWDVTQGGQPFPPTGENMAQLSFPALGNLLRRIVEAGVPTDDEKKGSSEPSSTVPLASTQPQQQSLNGPDTSVSPPASVSVS
jgi:hypothetical protein